MQFLTFIVKSQIYQPSRVIFPTARCGHCGEGLHLALGQREGTNGREMQRLISFTNIFFYYYSSSICQTLFQFHQDWLW